MKLPVEESDFVYCDVQDIVRYLQAALGGL